jgi:hypothetical protein
MQEPQFERARVDAPHFDARAKLPRISEHALNALERRLQEHRLPAAEEAFLAARLATYRKLAQLGLCGD